MVDGDREVIMRAAKPAEPAIRSQVWAKLGGIDSPHLQRARDAQRAGEWQVEVADVPRGVRLSEWRATQKSIEPALLQSIAGQLAEALGALHAFELVHLGIRPEVIFVEPRDATLHCVVAGLDSVTTFDRTGSVPAAFDPFYAPPEAVGLSVHLPGPGLCAWDWWSVGRVLQQLILGVHVIGYLEKCDVGTPSPELLAKAEAMLLEADPKGPRAGAVELMPSLDARQTLLLRGLLTSAKEARWTVDNMDRWVRGQPVKEHYTAPRAETHFRWRGRPCTVPEVASALQTAEHWAENSVQLFESTTPGTLAHFLHWSQTQSVAHEQLTSALELADSLPLKMSSPAAQREAVTAVALMQLSKGNLVWRGRTFDSATVTAMLNELGDADGLMVLRALSTRSTALQIERVDAAGGRLLTELGRTVNDVEGILRRHSWLGSGDIEGSARVFRLALESLAALRAVRDELGQKFAGSDHAPMDKIFKATPGRVELVIVAWAAVAPERFRFYSQAEAARRRAETLRKRGGELTAALTWLRFGEVLALSPGMFGAWILFLLTWVILAGAAFALWPGVRGMEIAAGVLIVGFAARIGASRFQAKALQRCVADAQWSWRSGPADCRTELRMIARDADRRALESELADVTSELGRLTNVQPTPEPLLLPPNFVGMKMAVWASWALFAGLLVAGGWRMHAHHPSLTALTAAWSPPKPLAAAAVAAAEKSGEHTETGELKTSWPFRAGDQSMKLNIKTTAPATSGQIAEATKLGRKMVAPYRAESITTLIVLPVKAEPDQVAVMIFDGRRGELANQQVYVVDTRPIARTWVEVGDRQGFFLDN
jgi:hypothetical protein